MSAFIRASEKINSLKKAGVRFVGDSLLQNEYLSDDGSTIYCQACNKAKFVKTKSSFCNAYYWSIANGVGCDCDRAKRLKKYGAENKNKFTEVYKQTKFMGVSKGYLKNCNFNDYFYANLPDHIKRPMRFVWNYCNKFSECRNKGMYIYSLGPGLCKTSMVACARNYLLEQGISCILTNISEISDAYQNDSALYDIYEYVDVLIIDDIGIQDPKELLPSAMGKINNSIYELLNTRMLSNDKPTFFTSNYSIEELLERGFLPQTVDRIRGIASDNVLKLCGRSIR